MKPSMIHRATLGRLKELRCVQAGGESSKRTSTLIRRRLDSEERAVIAEPAAPMIFTARSQPDLDLDLPFIADVAAATLALQACELNAYVSLRALNDWLGDESPTRLDGVASVVEELPYPHHDEDARFLRQLGIQLEQIREMGGC
jgi:hypothetical protein